jgi:hypothetical protein
LWSDGDDYPEMIIDWYKAHDYQFLALSDHNVIQMGERWTGTETNKGGTIAMEKYLKKFGDKWVEQREKDGRHEVRLKTLEEFRLRFEESGRFLLVQSEEITSHHLSAPVHINVTNPRELIQPFTGSDVHDVMQQTINAVLEQRRRTGQPMFPHLNHPNFGWGVTAEELMRVQGERFFEVYNGHPVVHNLGDALHAGTERMWDVMLAMRLAVLNMETMYGLGTDDSHNYHQIGPKGSNSGRGWVMVRAASLTPEALIAAMEAGDFYASSGVRLKEVHREAGKYSIAIDAEPGVSYTTQFIGTRKGFDQSNEPIQAANGEALRVTHRYSPEIGVLLSETKGSSANYALRGDEIYVRARITSTRPKSNAVVTNEVEMAWTQPLTTGVK